MTENEKPNPASEPLPLGPFATLIREAVQYRGPKDHEDYPTVAREADARIVALETENRRLREALEKIVAPSSSSNPRWWREIARRALQGDQNVTGT